MQTLQPVGEEEQLVPLMHVDAGQVSVPQLPLAQLTSQEHASRQLMAPHEPVPSQRTLQAPNPQLIVPQFAPLAQVMSQA